MKTFSHTLVTSLGTDSCGSPVCCDAAAEANSHIYNGKQGPFSTAIVPEKHCFIESDVLLHHRGKQAGASHSQQVDINTFHESFAPRNR